MNNWGVHGNPWTDIPEQYGVSGGGLPYIGIGEIRASPISDRADIGSDIGPTSRRRPDRYRPNPGTYLHPRIEIHTHDNVSCNQWFQKYLQPASDLWLALLCLRFITNRMPLHGMVRDGMHLSVRYSPFCSSSELACHFQVSRGFPCVFHFFHLLRDFHFRAPQNMHEILGNR